MLKLKVTRIGDALGLILPEEALAKLKTGEGDEVFAIETADGYTLSSQDQNVAEQIELGREFMRRYHETLRVLAK